MLRQGVRLEVIGVMLGPEDYNTTRQYVSLDDRFRSVIESTFVPLGRVVDKVQAIVKDLLPALEPG